MDLIAEEEGYRMLQEIARSPEFLKLVSGSSLKGSIDPKCDKLSDQDRDKLKHLDNMEKRGFDVDELRQVLLLKAQGGDEF